MGFSKRVQPSRESGLINTIALILLNRWLEEPEEKYPSLLFGDIDFDMIIRWEDMLAMPAQQNTTDPNTDYSLSPLNTLSFFNVSNLDKEFLIENRHQNDQLQHKYDERFGLVCRSA